MTDGTQPEKTLDDLLTEYNIIADHVEELRRHMKELSRQIEARAGAAPPSRSSHEIVIPKEPIVPDPTTSAQSKQGDAH